MADQTNPSQSHYQHGSVEVIVALDVLGHPSQNLARAIALLCRSPHSGTEAKDIRNACWYIRHAILDLGCNGWPMSIPVAAQLSLANALAAGIPQSEVNKGPIVTVQDLPYLVADMIKTLVCLVPESKAMDFNNQRFIVSKVRAIEDELDTCEKAAYAASAEHAEAIRAKVEQAERAVPFTECVVCKADVAKRHMVVMPRNIRPRMRLARACVEYDCCSEACAAEFHRRMDFVWPDSES